MKDLTPIDLKGVIDDVKPKAKAAACYGKDSESILF